MIISKEFGLNPSIVLCEYCGRDEGSIVCLGANHGKKAPTYTKVEGMICEECRGIIDHGGLIIIETLDNDKTKETGRMVGLKKEAEVAKKCRELAKNPEIRVAMMPKKLFSEVFDEVLEEMKK